VSRADATDQKKTKDLALGSERQGNLTSGETGKEKQTTDKKRRKWGQER
jgi:hypothetical protein